MKKIKTSQKFKMCQKKENGRLKKYTYFYKNQVKVMESKRDKENDSFLPEKK